MTFEKVKKNLGFGCMRLKMTDGKVDYNEFCAMIDEFIAAGFNYFDTAHGYIDGQSETAIRDCLVKRYDREAFVLANKLSFWCFEKEEEIVPLFEKQLELCGVEYFDFYLLHCLTKDSYEKHKACNSFGVLKRLKEEGKIKHIAASFHDTAEVLDKILSEQPILEAIQLQLNYLDYDDPGVQSKACYDVAAKHGKKVIVMEPVRGGLLANLPNKAKELFKEFGSGSDASFALRYAASYPNVFMVLSGMGNMDMMRDNIGTFTNLKPMSDKETQACDRAREIIRTVRQVPCTACGYCTNVCQKGIPIPEILSVYNERLAAKITCEGAMEKFPKGKPHVADCIKCGKCETVCPQSIEIRKHFAKILDW